jgi:Family of unknown function (DUF6284)
VGLVSAGRRRRLGTVAAYDAEPTADDLAAIEAEWPLIDAELAVLDAQIRALSAAGGPSPLDWRRLRRAERRVLTARLRRAPPAVGEVPRVAS